MSEVIQELLTQTIARVYDREAQILDKFSTDFKVPVSKPAPQTKPIGGSGSKGVIRPKLGTFSNNDEGFPPTNNTINNQGI